MKKRHLIMLITSIIFILCVCASLLFMFFFTDIFKSNKTLFSKYISKNIEIIDFINDKDIKSYVEKQKSTPYLLEGSIKTNVTFPDSSQSQIANALQNCNITFNGKVDNSNKYYSEIIKANYSDTQSMEFNLFRNNDIYAFKIADLLTKYIGMENSNLKEFAQKMQLSDTAIKAIPDKIEFEELDKYTSIFSEDDLDILKKNYLKIISDNLTDDMFSKEKTAESTIYSLNINKTSIKNIRKKILESLKDDELIFNRIKEYLINNYSLTEETVETYITQFKEQIQKSIDSDYTFTNVTDIIRNRLNTQTENAQTNNEDIILTIKVYTKNSNLLKTEFITHDFGNFVYSKSANMVQFEIQRDDQQLASAYIQKIKSTNETKFELACSLNNVQVFDLTTSFSGLNSNSVNEISELAFEIDLGNSSLIDAKTKFTTSYKKTKTFETFQKDEVQNSEILLLNTAPSSESIQNLFEKISAKVVEQNSYNLKSIGLNEFQNPFIYYLPSIANISSVYIIQNPENAPLYSIPLVLTGISVSMLAGDNAILNKAQEQNSDIKTNRDQYLNQLANNDPIEENNTSKDKMQNNLEEIKEKISSDINSEIAKLSNKKNSKNASTKNKTKTQFEAIDKLLKNYKINNSDFTYSYKNNKVKVKHKNDSTISATGKLSSDGNFKWNK